MTWVSRYFIIVLNNVFTFKQYFNSVDERVLTLKSNSINEICVGSLYELLIFIYSLLFLLLFISLVCTLWFIFTVIRWNLFLSQVLQHIVRFLDSFSLSNLSLTSLLLRDVCSSVLKDRGLVHYKWEKHKKDGRSTWKTSKYKVCIYMTVFHSILKTYFWYAC